MRIINVFTYKLRAFFSSFFFIVLIFTFCTEGNSRNTLPEKNQPAPVKFKKQSIVDRQMFNNMEVCSFLIPEDWQLEGGVNWYFEGDILKVNIEYSVFSTNREAVLKVYPYKEFSLGGNPYYPSGWGYTPPLEIEGIIREYYIPQYVPEAKDYKIINVVNNRESAKQLKERTMYLLKTISVPIMGMSLPNMEVENYSIDLEYYDGSKKMAAFVVINKIISTFYGYGMPDMTSYSLTISDMRVPLDKKEFYGKILCIFNNSTKSNYEWEAASLKLGAINAKQRVQSFAQAQRNTSRIISEGFDEIRQMQDQTNNFVNQTNDRIWNSWMNTSSGTAAFSDPQSNTTYNLPSGYHYYIEGSTIYMFDEHPINPADYLQGDYRELR